MDTVKTCALPGCDKPVKMRFDVSRRERWCSMHYERWRLHGTTGPRPKRLCSLEGCRRLHWAHGWCTLHYWRWTRTGGPGPVDSTRIPLTSGPEMRSTRGDEEKLRKVWRQMRARCENHKEGSFQRYGARGIKVCPEWAAYVTFRTWALSAGYQDGLTIDRIDNDGDYEPGNCRWVTYTAQARNKRSNRLLTAFGETKTMREWVDDPRCVASYAALSLRLTRRKWDVERALTTPIILNNDQATECPSGHPYDDENTAITPEGWRRCKTCNRNRARARRGLPPS